MKKLVLGSALVVILIVVFFAYRAQVSTHSTRVETVDAAESLPLATTLKEGTEKAKMKGQKQKKGIISSLSGDLALTPEQKQQIREARQNDASREEILSLLTPNQKTYVDEQRVAKRVAKRLEDAISSLELSAEQIAELESLIEQNGSLSGMRKVLTEEQKQQWDELRNKSTNDDKPANKTQA
ncbi:hypothetical protein EY643_00900 [Halioglobus maricola]|uniref:Uncharacterized protein n=1 Tax=Halioglobus maricola TaxID=2601894 RepID=A0A5P9NFP3_9GAMM|nr:hypothetical protein [Halioglobus maricola]QFU74319.1 hypothetical protein EY643_00900 [Halioglobus maricola]